MQTTRMRFFGVALLTGVFAIGMATFLNYYKYKSTLGQIVKTRMLEIGLGIENSIQSSLALDMSFSELGTLPSLLDREIATDRLIRGIDVFDSTGRVLYSTEYARVGQAAPQAWMVAIRRVKGREWDVEEARESISGMALKNNFDLTVGYIAMRYSRDEIERNVSAMGARLLAISAVVFGVIALLVLPALLVVIRGFERDLAAIEREIRNLGNPDAPPMAGHPALGGAVAEVRQVLLSARTELETARRYLAGRG